MYEYLVYWFLIVNSTVSCPDQEPYDELGRPQNATCLVAHYTSRRDSLTRVFKDKQDAVAFYEMALQEVDTLSIADDRIIEVQLDSIWVE